MTSGTVKRQREMAGKKNSTPSPIVSSEVETPGAVVGVSTSLDTNGGVLAVTGSEQ
jgi:hypothetical protein